MKKLVIIGAGSIARELICWLPGMLGYGSQWELRGLLADGTETLTERGYEEPLLGGVFEYPIQPEDVFIVAIASTKPRIEIARRLAEKGAQFATLIHETALVSKNVVIKPGTMVFPRVIISCDVTIGEHVIVNCMSTVGHDAKVGNGCTLSAHCELTGFVQLEQGVFMGSHATVLPKVKIGEFAVLGAGTAVVRNVQSHSTVLGVPGKKLPSI